MGDWEKEQGGSSRGKWSCLRGRLEEEGFVYSSFIFELAYNPSFCSW